MYLGFIELNEIIYFLHQSRNGNGIPTDADSLPTYRVYELPSEAPLATGTTGLFDDANTTGLYLGSVTCSSGLGFEAGKTYAIRVADTVSSTNYATLMAFSVI